MNATTTIVSKVWSFCTVLKDDGMSYGDYLEQACPGVSKDMVRRVLREQKNTNAVECQGREPAARWKKKG